MFRHRSPRGAIPVGDPSHSLRRLVLGVTALTLAMLYSASVGAQSPYPPNTVVSSYFDPRYCDGAVSVVTDSGGNLIDVCTTTGQRIYPVYPDTSYPTGYPAGYVTGNVVNPAYTAPAIVNPSTSFNGAYANGTFFNGNFCSINVANCATLPAGGTQVGNLIYYTDNRFCSDGKLVDVIG
ncbi:MAG: hypothetical protein ACR2M3_11945 [Thermomicrobiales bacterium]